MQVTFCSNEIFLSSVPVSSFLSFPFPPFLLLRFSRCRGRAGCQDEGGEFVPSEVFSVPQCHLPTQNWPPHPHPEPVLWRRQRPLQPQPRYKSQEGQSWQMKCECDKKMIFQWSVLVVSSVCEMIPYCAVLYLFHTNQQTSAAAY